MSVDLADPDISLAYRAIIGGDSSNWLLLGYNKQDTLSLFATGTQGIPELRTVIQDAVPSFAFCRQEFDRQQSYVVIVFIPESISGVQRARALVHSRRVGAMFKKGQATLTVGRLESLTTMAVHQALADPEAHQFGSADRSISLSHVVVNKALPTSPEDEQMRRSASETYAQPSFPPKPNIFSHFLRRKKRTDNEAPPPTPPKDMLTFPPSEARSQDGRPLETSHIHSGNVQSAAQDTPLRPNRMLDFVSHSPNSDEVVVISSSSPTTRLQENPRVRKVSKWTKETSVVSRPEEKARRRVEAQRRMEMEEEEALREEAERQARLKFEKQELLREAEKEEMRRKAILEEELRLATAGRLRKERQAKIDEELRLQELRERKKLEREKRLEDSRKLEEWRREQVSVADELTRRRESSKRQAETDRQARIKLMQAQVKCRLRAASLVTGWVTMQTNDSLVWKRRFFKFMGSQILFFRSPSDMNQVVDKIELRGRVRGFKEWNEGHEELEAIPHSFAIEFRDGQGSWALFSDSEEEKDMLLGLLHQAAGL